MCKAIFQLFSIPFDIRLHDFSSILCLDGKPFLAAIILKLIESVSFINVKVTQSKDNCLVPCRKITLISLYIQQILVKFVILVRLTFTE